MNPSFKLKASLMVAALLSFSVAQAATLSKAKFTFGKN